MEIRGRGETHDGSTTAVISVSECGTGLAPDQVDSAFQAFYTTKPNGMGMGLAISRSIIEAHDGRLWAGRNPDRGATITFRLPAVPIAPSRVPSHCTDTSAVAPSTRYFRIRP